jgi:hypothetical protein
MAKRSTQKRELVNTGADARYVKRATSGRFRESDDVARSQLRDKATKARTAVKAGFGDQGDRKSIKRTAKKR